MKMILMTIAILVLAIAVKRATYKEEVVLSDPLCFDSALTQQSAGYEEATNTCTAFAIPSGKRHIFINQYFTNNH